MIRYLRYGTYQWFKFFMGSDDEDANPDEFPFTKW